MIIINKAGLSEAERASVLRPLAANQGNDLDIDNLGDNLAEIVEVFRSVIVDAIENIDQPDLKSK